MTIRLHELIGDACERLLERATVLGGPRDITEVFIDADDFAEFDQDSDSNYDRGLIEGVAAALGMTSLELLAVLRLPSASPK